MKQSSTSSRLVYTVQRRSWPQEIVKGVAQKITWNNKVSCSYFHYHAKRECNYKCMSFMCSLAAKCSWAYKPPACSQRGRCFSNHVFVASQTPRKSAFGSCSHFVYCVHFWRETEVANIYMYTPIFIYILRRFFCRTGD